ncbi:MAG: hypothetical protein N4A61_01960 [Pelagimonas sp.]|jgi:hypothetical protein|nr:hypothetical protein [Pelagimonas sp.]
MECFIHVGLNKAGSSFVQSVLRANPDPLAAAGISYFKGGRHSGNAKALAFALRDGDTATVSQFLTEHVAQAKSVGAHRVLLSSEHLYHQVIVKDQRQALVTAARALGISKIHLLAYFRPPIPHAISAYCHRAGVHNVGPFDIWIKTGYELHKELPLFLDSIDDADTGDFDVAWTPVAYGPGQKLLDTLCAWLGISDLPVIPEGEVNISPSLGEAELLDQMQVRDPRAAMALRRQFKQISRSDKAPEPDRRTSYEARAALGLAPLNPHLARLEALINAPMQVTTPETEVQSPQEISLAPAQVSAVLALIKAPPPPNWLVYRIKRVFGLHKPRRP